VVISGARVLDLDAPGFMSARVDIAVRAGRIEAIGDATEALPDAELIDARGMLAMPGLVDAHLHSSGAFDRGRFDNLPLELFMLYEVPPLAAGTPDPATYRARTLLGAAERLRTGVTSVFDDPIYSPAATPELVDAVMGAYAEAGLRATVAIYQPDKPMLDWYPYLRSLLPDDLVAALETTGPPPMDEIMSTYEAFVARWHGADNGRVRCAISPSAPHRASDDYLVAMHALAKREGLQFVLHLYESKLQRVYSELEGRSFVRRLSDLGVLDSRLCAVHAVWVDKADAQELGAAGASVVHSPSGNARCGSGIMPWRLLAESGVNLALCTDEATVEDTCNLWNVGRLAAQLHKLEGPDYRRWPDASEILRSMTAGGARALGAQAEVGELRVGTRADLILIDLDTSTFLPFANLANHLVYGEDGRSIRMVIVDGRIVVRDGRVLTIDEDALREEVRELTQRSTADSAQVDAWARRLLPYLDEMYRRAAAYDVGFSRWGR
jgi:5-methylthioadenosine/S-adenosylhomocysteine deaminase